MTQEQKAAYIMAQAACLIAKVAGMQAENLVSLSLGQRLAYVEQDFIRAVDESNCHHNAVLSLFNGYTR